MTSLIWAIPVAAVLFGLALRSRYRRRLYDASRCTTELRRELSAQDAEIHLLLRAVRWCQVTNAIERRRTRAALAERDAAQWEAAATLRRVWTLRAENERLAHEVERLELEGLNRLDRELRQLGAG